MNEIKGKKILIVGFGLEGKSVLNYIIKNYPDSDITIADKNEKAIDGVDYRTQSGDSYLRHLETFDTVIRSPGLAPALLKNARHTTTATNIFFEKCPGITIGVTGTKGKSTTSSLLYEMLKTAGKDARLIGNIGNPMLDQLENVTKDTYLVIELSSYQLQDMQYSPHVAVVLPIYPEHLSYHGDFISYVEAKKNIVRFQKPEDVVVFYKHNEFSQEIANTSQAQKIDYATNSTVYDENYLKGKVNLDNIKAATTVAKFLKIDDESIQNAIENFKPLPHRLELVGTYKGITFYNDSLATIPQATIHALESLRTVSTLIAGGFDRGVSMEKLGQYLVHSLVKNLILFPDTGVKIAAALKKADPSTAITIVHVKTMEEAVTAVYQLTPKGTICVLSPAAASFNLFADYVDRGEQFKSWVEKLGKE